MRRLMIEASEKLARMLALKQQDPAEYNQFIRKYQRTYCRPGNATDCPVRFHLSNFQISAFSETGLCPRPVSMVRLAAPDQCN